MTATERLDRLPASMDHGRIYRQGQHSPCEHFARVGYDAIAATIEIDASYPHDEDADDWDARVRQWRDGRVLAVLIGERPKSRKEREVDPDAKEPSVSLAGHRITWPVGLPELKIWAGRATLETLVDDRRAKLHETPMPVGTTLYDWVAPYKTMSGLDPRTASTALDIGFSPAKLGMEIDTYVASELLAVVGMELGPIIRYGRKEYGYFGPDGGQWTFSVVERDGYHRMLTMSQRKR